MSEKSQAYGTQMTLRMNFPGKFEKDEQNEMQGTMISLLEKENLYVEGVQWFPGITSGGVDGEALHLRLREGRYTRSAVVCAVETMARYTDCEDAAIWIHDVLDASVIEARWYDELLKIWEIDTDLKDKIPFECGSTKILNILLAHAQEGGETVHYAAQHIMPRRKVVLCRAKNLADEANRILSVMDCEEIPYADLVAVLLPLVKPKWKA